MNQEQYMKMWNKFHKELQEKDKQLPVKNTLKELFNHKLLENQLISVSTQVDIEWTGLIKKIILFKCKQNKPHLCKKRNKIGYKLYGRGIIYTIQPDDLFSYSKSKHQLPVIIEYNHSKPITTIEVLLSKQKFK